MAELHPHEDAVIRKFFVHSRRLPFIRGLSGTAKSRTQAMSQICHFYDWVPGTAHEIPASDRHPDAVYQLLRAKGAPLLCHVMSEGDLDGRDMDLREALVESFAHASYCTILSCIPGRLAFYQDEYPEERYILER